VTALVVALTRAGTIRASPAAAPRCRWPSSWAVLLAGVAYLVIPADVLPDLFPWGTGFLDDAVVVTLALKGFIWLAPRQVVEEHVRLIDQGR